MTKKTFGISISVLFLFCFNALNFAKDGNKKFYSWDFLNTTAIGAHQFIAQNPEADGRGVVIFILDSGVDPGVSGLKETSTGEVKVVDVRDFSGQGDVALYSGEKGESEGEHFIEHPDGFRLFNYHKLTYTPKYGEYWIGYLDERRFRNSKVKDINNNGSTGDQFGVLAFETMEADSLVWQIYVDTDGDHQIDDEKPLHEYSRNYECFHFRGGDLKYDARPLNFALHLDTYGMKVTFHFDDEGHGTHVAGIAAGYRIYGQEDFNGIAPGAQIISLKIGNGNNPGGSTTTSSVIRAVEFIENYLQSHDEPIVINLSYGIGTIAPWESDLSNLFHQLILDHTNVFVCVSNGNDGPGIATTGCPADDPFVFSVGAFLPRNPANEILGMHLKKDQIYYFSSRGGKLNKPDAIAPGFASSTVPTFANNDLLRGTSMAAPQISGAAALLISAINNREEREKITSFMLKNSLKQSASVFPHFSDVDQGSGLVNIPRAYRLLKERLKLSDNVEPLCFEINSESQTNSDLLHDGSYWRVGGYFPADGEKAIFQIYPLFKDSLLADQRANFYRAYTLRASAGWLKPEKKSIYFHGESGVTVPVSYDSKQLTQPGIYTGKIFAQRKKCREGLIDFELLNTVIIPYHFSYENNYTQEFVEKKLTPGELRRYFLQTPPGASDLNIILKTKSHRSCRLNFFCHTPTGENYCEIYGITSKDSREKEIHISGKELKQGIWEIVVQADPYNEKNSSYILTVQFAGFEIKPEVIYDYRLQLGGEPNGSFVVCNQFNQPFYGFAAGELSGYQREKQCQVENVDYFNYSFRVNEDIEKIRFSVEIDPDAFLKMSDVILVITDSRQRKIADDALTYPSGKIEMFPQAGEMYDLKIKAAFVHGNSIGRWRFKLTEQHELREKIKIKVYAEQNRLFWLYPATEQKLDFVLDGSPRIAPDGFKTFGAIKFYSRDGVRQVAAVPILLNKN